MYPIFITENKAMAMSRLSLRKVFILAALLPCLAIAQASEPATEHTAQKDDKSPLHHPMKDIFSHKKHESAFLSLGVVCTDCHRFSVKPVAPGPLAPEIAAGYLRASKKVCHQCHLGRVSLPAPNQCMVCHVPTDAIKPKDHFLSWQIRHGRMAQMDRDSCKECHTPNSCNQCHSRLDRMNPQVHPGNFRLTHSIRARVNPQSCIECHKARAFCIDCHSGRRAL